MVDWGKVAIGATAIVVGGVAIYELGVKVFAAGPAAASQQLSYWSGEYAKELNAILAQNTLPTAVQENVLAKKKVLMDEAYNELFSVWGVAETVLIAAIAAAATVWLVSSLARSYWNIHITQVHTPAGVTQLIRSSLAIDVYAVGNTSLALALQDQTQTVFSTLYSPAFQAEIETLQTQTETLQGTQLLLTETLIENLEEEVSSIIPAIFDAAQAILLAPPPI